ncbi:MFS transporter [Paraburkholderia sp. JHI869]|uniref:MFS transporter n=1 Tax=Paraburkholderia sp. JHI869 TaxID=3112959 RepID=UPI003178FE47
MRQIDLRRLVDNAPIGRLHFAVILWCGIVSVLDGYDLSIAGVALPSMMKAMGVSPATAGIMVSSALFGMMFGAIGLGTLADRIGRRWAFVLCVGLFSVFTAVAGFANDPITFSLMRFLAGVGVGGVTPTVAAHVTEYSPRRLRTTLVSVIFSGFAVGGMVAAMTAKALLEKYGWQSVFFAACLPMALIPGIFLSLPESLPFLLRKGDTQSIRKIVNLIRPEEVVNSDDVFVLNTVDVRADAPMSMLFRDGRGVSTLMFWISSFMCLFMVYGLSSWLTKLLASAGHSLGNALTFVIVLNVGALIGTLAGGWLSDRVHIKYVLVGMYSLAGLSIAILGYVPNDFLAYLCVAIAGGCTIGTQTVGYAYAGQYYPMSIRSTGIGWVSGVGRTGAILSPIVIGVIVGLSLPLQTNFIALAVPAVIATMAVGFVDDARSKRLSMEISVDGIEASE